MFANLYVITKMGNRKWVILNYLNWLCFLFWTLFLHEDALCLSARCPTFVPERIPPDQEKQAELQCECVWWDNHRCKWTAEGRHALLSMGFSACLLKAYFSFRRLESPAIGISTSSLRRPLPLCLVRATIVYSVLSRATRDTPKAKAMVRGETAGRWPAERDTGSILVWDGWSWVDWGAAGVLSLLPRLSFGGVIPPTPLLTRKCQTSAIYE